MAGLCSSASMHFFLPENSKILNQSDISFICVLSKSQDHKRLAWPLATSTFAMLSFSSHLLRSWFCESHRGRLGASLVFSLYSILIRNHSGFFPQCLVNVNIHLLCVMDALRVLFLVFVGNAWRVMTMICALAVTWLIPMTLNVSLQGWITAEEIGKSISRALFVNLGIHSASKKYA